MTIGRRYLVGLAAVAAMGAMGAILAPRPERGAVLAALGVALLVQGPAGWWLVKSVGGPSFLLPWVVGMATRVALVGLFALVLVPRLGWPMGSTLISLVMALLAMLLVEVVVVNYGAKRLAALVGILVLFLVPSRVLLAQEQVGEAAHPAPKNEIDIAHHLANQRTLEVPCFHVPYACEVELPRWKPIQVGSVAIDLSPTRHSVLLVVAALIVFIVFTGSARAVARAHANGKISRGFSGVMEATVLYIRNEVILPNVGHHGEDFVNYLLTVFFFLLACNLLGLVPWSATATSNISVTAAMALVSFIVIEISGMRSLGFKGYMNTIFYVPHGVPTVLKPVLLVIMTPIEIIGKLAKPFALAVRLFANMTAGHVVVLALLGLTFVFHSYLVGIGASLMSTFIMSLELFVAFLQAFVFTLLTAVFIGLIRTSH